MWIKGCLHSSHTSVLINGNPTDEFKISKGVRQGDPLSPFLFITTMEGHSVTMRATCQAGVFQGIQLPHRGLLISHLLYTYDALFVGEWSKHNIKNLARILRCFHVASRLKVDFNKSKVFGVGACPQYVSRWATPLGCEPSILAFTYLGVPVGANMRLTKHWYPIVDKFQKKKLSSWKAKTLSFGGHLTLIKFILGNLPNYFLSLFIAHVGVLVKLEKLRRRFLWGGSGCNKIHWVS